MRLGNCKWLLAAGLVGGGVLAYHSRLELRQWVVLHQFQVAGLEQALPSEVYSLETNRWLEFDIPQETPVARIISNASIPSMETATPGTQWGYAIGYEFLGARGRTNRTGVYHFKGEQLVFIDKQTGKPVEVNSYLDRRLSPLSARHWIVNLKDPGLTGARVLRLRLHSSHPELVGVGIRVYFQTEVPERKVSYLWDRLSDDQKRDLARGNVYGFEGLNSWEKSSLLRNHWSVASPEGIPGRDFVRRILYVRDDNESLQVVKNWLPAGIAVDADHSGVLPITNAPGTCQVQMANYTFGAVPQAVSNVLLWHGELQRSIQTNQLTWFGTNHTLLSSNRDGLLQISSSRPVFVRTFQAEPGLTNEITPQLVHLLTFTSSPTNSVDYDVDHAGQEPTLFRIEVRRFTPSTTSAISTGLVQYALQTENGAVFQAGDVTLTNMFSPFDWLVTTNGLTNITEPQSLYFILPPAVKTLRVSSPRETVLVNAYSRPSQLVKKTRVPEDYSPGSALAPEQPSWFTLRPPDYIARREAGQACIVRLQPRLPEYDPLVLAGQYEWDSFLPESDPRGQMIMFPPADDQPPRPESLPFSYFPVMVGCKQRVRLQGLPWEPQVEPTLVLVFSNGVCGAATVSIDGQTLLDNRVNAPVTEVRLGALKAGEHELSINVTSPASAYLNDIASATNAAFLQRFCLMASSNALFFPYLKRQTNAELLVLRVFSQVAGTPQPFQVHVKVQTTIARGIGPFADLTFLEREAQVTPGPGGRTCLVATAAAGLDDGQPLFFPMGSDLSPGEYKLEVRVASSSPHWLSLSRTTPGLAEKLSLTSQPRTY
jgi:hypothetical protein